MQLVVVALYKFACLPDYQSLIPSLKTFCVRHGIKGTLLLAQEGINGTIAGKREDIEAVLAYLKQDPRLENLEYKESLTHIQPFPRMKVRAKKEIVTLGIPGIDPVQRVGAYVSPEQWNDLITDPEVTVIDTRNTYECDIGTFQGAVNPYTESFREFPAFVKQNLDPGKHKKIAMYCTGGIRCEKASSYMLNQGFREVYHLKGGILKYMETVNPAESLWQGECFVFDNRVALRHDLQKGEFELCHGCRNPISVADRQSAKYVEGIVCPHCLDKASAKKIRRAAARHHQITLARRIAPAPSRDRTREK